MSITETDARQLSRPLLVVLGVVAAAAVAYLAVAVLGPSNPTELAASPTEAAGVGPDATAEPAEVRDPDDALDADGDEDDVVDPDDDADGSDVDEVAQTFEVFDARDPFEQLVADGGEGVADVESSQPTTATSAADDATAVPDASSAPAGLPPGATPPVNGQQPTTTPPSTATVGSTTILLDDVFVADDGRDVALVVIDGQGYEAGEGDTVDAVTVLDIAGNCATLRFGDKRFILCEGEQITK